MKFDETVIDKKLGDFKFTEKYVTVYIESPDVISYPDTVSMIMRCDDVFSYGSGNDKDYVKFIREFAGMPQELPDWVRNRVPKNYYDILEKQYTKELEAFNKKWNRNPSEYSPIFKVGLFCTCWANGPHSFVNLKTGKVQGYSVLGKWPGNVSECKEEMEWFTKLYPDYKFFLTFVDTDVLCTLMLYKGEIKVGLDADIALFLDNDEMRINENHGRCDYSIYEGLYSAGQFISVIRRGKFVLKNRTLIESVGKLINCGD